MMAEWDKHSKDFGLQIGKYAEFSKDEAKHSL